MSKKITKREKFEMLKAIPAVAENEMLVEFIDRELELLARKNSGDKKPTAQQVANDNIKATILEVLRATGKAMTITEIQKANGKFADLSNQKISSLTNQLVATGLVVKTTEKRKSLFKAI